MLSSLKLANKLHKIGILPHNDDRNVSTIIYKTEPNLENKQEKEQPDHKVRTAPK